MRLVFCSLIIRLVSVFGWFLFRDLEMSEELTESRYQSGSGNQDDGKVTLTVNRNQQEPYVVITCDDTYWKTPAAALHILQVVKV